MENQNIRTMFLEHIKKSKSQSTYASYKSSLGKFEKWYGKDANAILDERRADLAANDPMRVRRIHDVIEEFAKYLETQEHVSVNAKRTLCQGIIQFLSFCAVPVKVKLKTNLTFKTAIPDISVLRKMYSIGDLKEKLILSLGLDLAWRVGDFISIKKNDIPDLEQECPISIQKLTAKEKELSCTFISCETVTLLKDYMKTLRDSNEYLFANRNAGHVKDSDMNDTLKELGYKAGYCDKKGIVLNGKDKDKHFTFHCFRHRFLSTATSLGIDEDRKCLLVGKAIQDKSHAAYFGDVNLKNAFVEIRVKALSLTETPVAKENHEAIETLTSALMEQKRLNEVLLKKLDALTVSDAENKTRIDQLYTIAGIKKQQKST